MKANQRAIGDLNNNYANKRQFRSIDQKRNSLSEGSTEFLARQSRKQRESSRRAIGELNPKYAIAARSSIVRAKSAKTVTLRILNAHHANERQLSEKEINPRNLNRR